MAADDGETLMRVGAGWFFVLLSAMESVAEPVPEVRFLTDREQIIGRLFTVDVAIRNVSGVTGVSLSIRHSHGLVFVDGTLIPGTRWPVATTAPRRIASPPGEIVSPTNGVEMIVGSPLGSPPEDTPQDGQWWLVARLRFRAVNDAPWHLQAYSRPEMRQVLMRDGTTQRIRVRPFIKGIALRLKGDADGDGDVDLQDFAEFQRVFGWRHLGPNHPLDFDGDGDVDLIDFGRFQLAMGR